MRGHNRRMSEIHAGIGLANRLGLNERMQKRRNNYQSLYDLIIPEFRPAFLPRDPYMFMVDLSDYFSPLEFVQANIVHRLREAGVESSFGYYAGPLSTHSDGKGVTYDGVVNNAWKMTSLFGTQLAIPCHEKMSDADVEYVADEVNRELLKL